MCIFIFYLNLIIYSSITSFYLDEAVRAYDNKQYYQAIKYYDLAIDEAPKDRKIYYYRGLVYQELHDYRRAEKNFTTAIKLIHLPARNEHASYYFNRGLVRYELHQYHGSLEDFQETERLTSFPDYKTIANLAMTKYQLRDFEGSFEDAKRAHAFFVKYGDDELIKEMAKLMRACKKNKQ